MSRLFFPLSGVRVLMTMVVLGAAIALGGFRACAAEIMVAAAASLQDALREAAQAFEQGRPGDRVVISFASSGILCAQIERGAPADVFVSASQGYMNRLESQGLLVESSRRDLFANAMVLARPSGSGFLLKGLPDLLDPSVKRIAIGDPAHVPAGRYAKEVLVSAGLWDEVQGRLVMGMSVRQVRDYLRRGEVDAGLIYSTDAGIPGIDVVTVVPAGMHSPILYPGAVLAEGLNRKGGRAVLSYLSSPAAQKIFKNFGFQSVPKE